MNVKGFRSYLENDTYLKKGVETKYAKGGINTRIRKALELEEDLDIDSDDFVVSDEKFDGLLRKIREAKIETLDKAPKSNAARHYYQPSKFS